MRKHRRTRGWHCIYLHLDGRAGDRFTTLTWVGVDDTPGEEWIMRVIQPRAPGLDPPLAHPTIKNDGQKSRVRLCLQRSLWQMARTLARPSPEPGPTNVGREDTPRFIVPVCLCACAPRCLESNVAQAFPQEKVRPGVSVGPPRQSLVNDKCASVSRLLSFCTVVHMNESTHERIYTCTNACKQSSTAQQSAIGGAGVRWWHTRLLYSWKDGGVGFLSASPPFHQLWWHGR